MTVHFYDAGQALAALVKLPDGRSILVDTGESPKRVGCKPCKEWHERVMSGLKTDLNESPIDLVWITHQHSDHLGGAAAVLSEFTVTNLVDNGQDLDTKQVKAIHDTAAGRNVTITTVDPTHTTIPIKNSPSVTLTAIVPKSWPTNCSASPNDCSIGLRIDYCRSSLLFIGDAEKTEEAALDSVTPVTLLQVGHHGSNTSSTPKFLERTQPKYGVISSGKMGEGTNAGYCHPLQSTVTRFNDTIGGGDAQNVLAFDASVKCRDSDSSNWQEIPASDHLWFTARDGEIFLSTDGDGKFERVRK